MSEPTRSTPAGQRLIAGRYRLGRVIGAGSMGVVWQAYDEVLHRSVAVKEVRLPPGIPSAEANDARERTLREARAIAALTHPNVVAVHDVARQGVEPFVVMELLPGRSLATLVSRSGPLTAAQAAAVADAVASALDAAHRRGITHRDVKPGNVLVGNDGQVKLTDFGISRNVSEVTMTVSGLILGTPAYMAPEVAAGEPVTAAADLWGLGATLFAAVTGAPPYDAGGPLQTVTAVVHGEIPRPDADAPLADVITALMVRDPAARIGLVEVRRRIRPLLPEPGTQVFPPDDESDTGSPPADEKPTTHLAPVARPPGSVPLAPAPGPLPFGQPGPAARPTARRRGRLAGAAVALTALVLFLVAGAGGFAATRLFAGRPLTPPSPSPAAQPLPIPPRVTTLHPVTNARAAVTPDAPGGTFSVSVPTGWTEFAEQRTLGRALPESTALHWVKPDGTAELVVERFAGYYPAHGKADFLAAVRASDPAGNLMPITDRNGETNSFLFRTLSTGRSMYARVVRGGLTGNDLWVVCVTVPTVTEDSGTYDLFAHVVASFHIQN